MLVRLFLFLHLVLNISSAYGQCLTGTTSLIGTNSSTTGSRSLDEKIRSSKNAIENTFGITTDLRFSTQMGKNKISVRAYPNRLYTAQVVIDYSLLTDFIWKSDDRNLFTDYILAHTITHALQIKKQWQDTEIQSELIADYLAGYFLGKENYTSDSLEILFSSLKEIQSLAFCCEEHLPSVSLKHKVILAGYEASGIDTSRIFETALDYLITNADDSDKNQDFEICQKCNGEGKIKVPTSCYNCNSSGRKNCPECKGSGGHYETTYDSKGVATTFFAACSFCAGIKTVNCEFCEGTGVYRSPVICDFCNGSGKIQLK